MININSSILQTIIEIEKNENIKIIHAVESGSRAWNFASPDSDYDVRFIYVRSEKDYLRLDGTSDFINWQIDDVYDINGWDITKVLKQFYKSNPYIFEWSNSPIIYKTTDIWSEIYRVAKNYFSPRLSIAAYLGLANKTYKNDLQSESVSYKKYLYAIRPLLCCRYIEQFESPPPVNFYDLLILLTSKELRLKIDSVLEIKQQSYESEKFPHISLIKKFIEDELSVQEKILKEYPKSKTKSWSSLNEIFRNCIGV